MSCHQLRSRDGEEHEIYGLIAWVELTSYTAASKYIIGVVGEPLNKPKNLVSKARMSIFGGEKEKIYGKFLDPSALNIHMFSFGWWTGASLMSEFCFVSASLNSQRESQDRPVDPTIQRNKSTVL